MNPLKNSMEKYFEEIERKTDEIYEIAKRARSQTKDPELEPEIPRAGGLASRVEKLVGPNGVAEVIGDLEKQMPREEIALKIAEMIVDGKFGKSDEQTAAQQAVRTALSVLTEGIVVAPIEGITDVRIKNNFDGTRYLALYFASPIRAAGGTAAALAVLAGDFVRRRLYLNPYKATEREVERFVEEVEIYRTSIAREQYTPPQDDVRLAVQNIPVEITGDPSGREVAVMAFRDLERIGHNWVRGGAVLAMVEGVMQKAPKIMKYVNKLNIDGWSWLSSIIAKVASKEETGPMFPKGEKYLGEVIAGRPVFSHPGTKGHKGREGGFRLRYGRARNTGIAAIGVHPATMSICDDFLVAGTQLKTERPGKGGVVTPVDSIEGPIVKLKSGSVVLIDSIEQSIELRPHVDEILFLGDILIGFGEFLENNHPLMPSGYYEEWWVQEVEQALKDKKFDVDLAAYIQKPYPKPPSTLAVKISDVLGVPLHPKYTYCYTDMEVEELQELCNWLSSGTPTFEDGELKLLRLDLNQVPKRVLEELGVPHTSDGTQVIIEEHVLPLCKSLGLINGQSLNKERFEKTLRESQSNDIMEIVCSLAGFRVRNKATTRIGGRMGRPEKANPRKMRPPVHLLFPVGLRGGMTRSLNKAAEKTGEIYVELAALRCPKCGESGFTRKCQKCDGKAEYVKNCPKCKRVVQGETCPVCRSRLRHFTKRGIDLRSMMDSAAKSLHEKPPDLIKGVRGMVSGFKIPEPIEKGILRAKHGVDVFKDGTIRFDSTDVPLTHFIPQEIGTAVEKLNEMGYTEDKDGNSLDREDQIVELKVQDILISDNGGDYLLRVTKFIDDLLEKFYGLQRYYNASHTTDLIGHLVIGLAPHTSVGVIGRIIGFTRATVGYAHPFFHASKRRDCDGDEDCVMLLLDALLNFSKRFLPSKRGGTMDAPLILSTRINPNEIDKEAHNMDVEPRYPLEFYEATQKYANPEEMAKIMKTVEHRLGTNNQYTNLEYSFNTSDISSGPRSSRYKTLETMEEKTNNQLELAKKIRAVDARDVAEKLIEHHFIPDLKGNIRTFASQSFRCTGCNQIFRRIPTNGACNRCNGKLVLTVTRGGVEKYLQIAMRIGDEYGVTDYTKQRLNLTQRDIRLTFESDAQRQMSLADFL